MTTFLYLDKCQRVSHSLTGHLAFSAIFPLFVDRFGNSLQFCHLEFGKEGVSVGGSKF